MVKKKEILAFGGEKKKSSPGEGIPVAARDEGELCK